MTDHPKKLQISIVSFLIAGLRAEQNAFCWHMSHEVDVDHFVPDPILFQCCLNIAPAAGVAGCSFSTIHEKPGGSPA